MDLVTGVGSAASTLAAGSLAKVSVRKTAWVFLLALITLLLAMDRRIDAYDEGFMLTAALSMSAGEFPHRDFYFLYGPATPWLLSNIWITTAYSFLAARLYGLAIQAGIVAASYYLFAQLRIGLSATVALCATWLWLTALQSHLYPSFACVLLILISACLALHHLHEKHRRWPLLLAGVCIGSTTLFRYDAGVAAAAAIFSYIWMAGVWLQTCRRSRSDVAMDLLTVGVGVMLPVAPTIYLYMQAGMAQAWWRDVVTSSTTYYLSHRSLPFPNLIEVLRRPSWIGVFVAPIAIVVAAITYGRRSPADRQCADDLNKRRFVLLMCCVSAALYYKGVVRVQPLHAFMSIVPATLLLTVCAADWWKRPVRYASLVAISLLLLTSLPPAYAFASTTRRLAISPGRIMGLWLAARAPCHSSDGTTCSTRKALLGANLLPGQLIASDYVRQHSESDDPIFVADSRHDQFLINSVALYFIAERLPGSHWFIFDPGLQTRADVQALIIRDLEQHKVRWIVMDDVNDQVREPNQSSISSGVTLLDRWIALHYHQVSYNRPSSVWLSKSATTSEDLKR